VRRSARLLDEDIRHADRVGQAVSLSGMIKAVSSDLTPTSQQPNRVARAWTSWLVTWKVGIGVGICGGALMLVVAALAHDSASAPLVLIGGAWFAGGIAGFADWRRTASEIHLDGTTVTFRSPNGERRVSASDITALRYSRGDFNGVAPIRWCLLDGSTIRAAARMHGFLPLLVRLCELNPDLRLPD